LRVQATCPDCGGRLDCSLDVVSFVLEEIRRRARRLLREVHVIASAYHWSESEILALPEERRRRYLSLIEGGAA
jgi:hypothetical protein